MPKVIIDEKEIEVLDGTTVIEAAKKLGIFIPRYCYHPGLSIAGNCRMCMVEIKNMPKLQISCNTRVAEGMIVYTKSADVQEAQSNVLEYLLSNHPLDCPVCDQSGECDLQNYYMKYGLYDSRMTENKVKKAKAVPVGTKIMLDSERCILCSRCVRFCDEITSTSELGIINRGDHSDISVDQTSALKNNYSGNLADICPVGALTDRDFRFKCRVWYLQSTPSICPGCSRGCNIEIHWNKQRPYQTPNERVMRIKPRFNEYVNKWWICDEGRYGYHPIDKDRIRHFYLKDHNQNKQVAQNDVIEHIASSLKDLNQEDIAVFLSAKMTCEDLYLAKKLFVEALGIPSIISQVPESNPQDDGLLLTADKNPNTLCAKLFDLDKKSYEDCISNIRKHQIKMVFVFGHDFSSLSDMATAKTIRQCTQYIVYLGTNTNAMMDMADIVIPAAVYAEVNGTFINSEGRIQRIFKAFEPLENSMPYWMFIQILAKALNINFNFEHESDIFQTIASEYKAFHGLSHQNIGKQGALLLLNETMQVGLQQT